MKRGRVGAMIKNMYMIGIGLNHDDLNEGVKIEKE
jgi:hypothetical protein